MFVFKAKYWANCLNMYFLFHHFVTYFLPCRKAHYEFAVSYFCCGTTVGSEQQRNQDLRIRNEK